MKGLDRLIGTVEDWINVVTFTVMLTLTFVNVISRFVLHMSLSFTEEIVTGLFVLCSFAGSSVAMRNHAHLGLDFVTGFMPTRVQKGLLVLANLLAMGFCAILLYYGAEMVRQEFAAGQVSATMQWPEWIYGMTIPVGAGLLLLRYLLDTVIRIRDFVGKED